MRIAITGAGKAGRSIARELVDNGHEVLLIDRDPAQIRPQSVPRAEWLLADACEISSLNEAHLESCDVAIAATGDDRANLVHSLLAKTEFGVARVVARVNHPNNEWLFDHSWGVDVAVSTPHLMGAVVDEALSTGDLVRLFTFQSRDTTLVELTLTDDTPVLGQSPAGLELPAGTVLVAIIRGGVPKVPAAIEALKADDELIFLAAAKAEAELTRRLAGHGAVGTMLG